MRQLRGRQVSDARERRAFTALGWRDHRKFEISRLVESVNCFFICFTLHDECKMNTSTCIFYRAIALVGIRALEAPIASLF